MRLSIRHSIRLAPGILVVASLVASTSSVAGRSPMAIGVSQERGSRDPAAVRDFAAKAGHMPASWTIWSNWGDPYSKHFPTSMARSLIGMGVTPMIWWQPARTLGSCDFARHRVIANGRYDRYIKRWARDARSVGGKVIVRWAQEINGGYFPWGLKNGQCGNTISSYKAAWRHIVRLFRRVGATNVRFAWTVSNDPRCRPQPCNPYRRYFPGARFVHYAGFSSFNWGAYRGTWVTMADGVRRSYQKIRAITKKPIIVIELATNTGSQSKPEWIRRGYPEVYARFPGIKGVSYLNVDLRSIGHPDWSLNTPRPEAMEAYRDVATQSRFQGDY
jgi:hypothetical protein